MSAKNLTVNETFYSRLSQQMKNNDELSLQLIYSLFPEINRKTISWRLYSLVQEGKLFKTGHGYYSMQQNRENSLSAGYEYMQKKSQKIYDILVEYGYNFYMTGLDSLVGEVLHMPENYPVLITIEESGINEIQEVLIEKELIVLAEKDRELLGKTVLKRTVDVILLNGKDFSFSTDSISQKEKGFVDLYYAVTRLSYGVSIPELSRIYQNLQRNKSIAKTKIKSAAKDRRIATEINWLIELDKASEKALEFMNYQIKEAK